VRYWACNGRPGTDTAVDTGVMKIGRRLAIKILNASKFALGRLAGGPVPGPAAVSTPLDRALLARLADVVTQATAAFEEFDYARAQEFAETFFWSFCDDYVELVKTRAYGEGDGAAAAADSARATLALALSVQLRLFAPFLPFVTEEVWRWWQPGSVHRAAWPTVAELEGATAGDWSVLQVAGEVLGAIRRAKTTEKRSMRAKVHRLTVSGPADILAAVDAARGDLIDAGGVEELLLVGADTLSVVVELAEEA
jgi:valyl-tRNA synthetase